MRACMSLIFSKFFSVLMDVFIDPCTISWRVPRTFAEIMFGEILSQYKINYEPLAKFLTSEKFVVYGIITGYRIPNEVGTIGIYI